MDSILTSIKKVLGITEDYTNFDEDIIMHINTAFATLNQLGVGPTTGFMIEDKTSTWEEFITQVNLTMVKSYMFLKVRLLFDPPTSASAIESMERMLSELEWRIFLVGDVDRIAAEAAESTETESEEELGDFKDG